MKLIILLILISACTTNTTTRFSKFVSPQTDSRSVASFVCGDDWSPKILDEWITAYNTKYLDIECTLKKGSE